MQVEITRGDDLKREVWQFSLYSEWTMGGHIYLTTYRQEPKLTKRHGWTTGDRWDRYSKQFSTIATPPLPPDVVQEAKDTFKAQIDKLEVTL